MAGEITIVVVVFLVAVLVIVTTVPFERKIIRHLPNLAEHNRPQVSVTIADYDSTTVSDATFYPVLLQSPFSLLISLHGELVFQRMCPTAWTYFSGTMILDYLHEDSLVHHQRVLQIDNVAKVLNFSDTQNVAEITKMQTKMSFQREIESKMCKWNGKQCRP